MRIIAIIPARGGSKRLEKKNLFPLKGKPLLVYTIEACRKSNYINEIFVSSDDDEILNVAKQNNVVPLKRKAGLSDDLTPKMEVIRDALKNPVLIQSGIPEIVVIPQANSPQIKFSDIDQGIDFLLRNNLWEVMSADSNGVQNAAFRIIKTEHINNTFLSAHCGFVIADCIDVHTMEDIKKLEELF